MLQWILAACSLVGVYLIAHRVVGRCLTHLIARQRYEAFQRYCEGIEEDINDEYEVSSKKSS